MASSGLSMTSESSGVFRPLSTQGHVLCCLCGTSILPNPANMCVNCLRSQVDISDGVQKQVTVLYCNHCGRYLQPPKHYVRAELESKELLTFCLKRVKGLQKVKLVDAGFIWTEPHSKRLKVKVTVQAEVLNGTILQQTFVIDFIVEWNMCPDCNRAQANPNSWVACVQVRQHVYHKRTFFFLEQLILKHNAAESCVNIKDIHEGVDFFFSNRAHALKFIDFLQSVVPIRFRHDKQLVSHNIHESTYNYKYTFSVEIVPICKEDLICLPHKLSSSLGSIGPLVLCTRVTNTLVLTDPTTLRTSQIEANAYWRSPFTPIMNQRQLVPYMVLDIELLPTSNPRFTLADVQVARMSDLGSNDKVYYAKTHLGQLLHPGDIALGYDLANANAVGLDLEAFVNRGGQLPDVVLVRKSYEEKRRKRRQKGVSRQWKLRHLDMEMGEVGGRHRVDRDEDTDKERFLEEVEEDADMRARINVYKADPAAPSGRSDRPQHAVIMSEDDEDDEDGPDIPLEELLDDFGGLDIDDDEEDDEEDEEMMEG